MNTRGSDLVSKQRFTTRQMYRRPLPFPALSASGQRAGPRGAGRSGHVSPGAVPVRPGGVTAEAAGVVLRHGRAARRAADGAVRAQRAGRVRLVRGAAQRRRRHQGGGRHAGYHPGEHTRHLRLSAAGEPRDISCPAGGQTELST